jgi:ankyrin repeat protein
LVEALQAETFNFKSFEAQVMLKEAASRGTTATVRDLLEAGVPLVPIPAPKPRGQHEGVPFEAVGWLNAASGHSETLQTLIDAGASNNDQGDKDLALVGAARSGNVEAVRALVAYGANPNADFSKLTVTESSGGMTMGEQGAGNLLIYAAESGNPDMLREILRYSPKLEARDREGKTAVFAAESRYQDKDGARAECVRLLAQAGANVNARDNDGNTPLHETYLTEVEEELLKLGADVNARNKEGETPIFTTVDDSAIPLFVEHGADLTIRNNKGQTVVDAAKSKGPERQETLRKAIENLSQH